MSNLIAVAYDDVDTAKNMLRTSSFSSPYGGRVIHSSLSDEAEAHLREALTVPAA